MSLYHTRTPFVYYRLHQGALVPNTPINTQFVDVGLLSIMLVHHTSVRVYVNVLPF